MNAFNRAARPASLQPARARLCPLCEEALLQLGALWLCGWCGYRIGVAEPKVTRQQVAEATARFVAQGGRITRLPDGPDADEEEDEGEAEEAEEAEEEAEDEAKAESPQEEQSQSPAREQSTG